MNEMRRARELAVQIEQMIPPFVQKHGFRADRGVRAASDGP